MKRHLRRTAVFVIGTALMLTGLIIGPSLFFVPAGLAVLAAEYLWAERLLARVKSAVRKMPR